MCILGAVLPHAAEAQAASPQPDERLIKSAVLAADAAYLCDAQCTGAGSVPPGFTLIDHMSDPVSQFQAAAYREEKTGRIFIAYAGRDADAGRPNKATIAGLVDTIPTQRAFTHIDEANDFAVRAVKAALANRPAGASATPEIIVTGHSLGGALAQYVGAVSGWSTYTFNSLMLPRALTDPLGARPTANITNLLRDNDLWVGAANAVTALAGKVLREDSSKYLGQVIECPGANPDREASADGHSRDNFKIFLWADRGLAKCHSLSAAAAVPKMAPGNAPSADTTSYAVSRAELWRRYQAARAAAWADYQRTRSEAWQAYRAARSKAANPSPVDLAYNENINTIDQEYNRSITTIDRNYNTAVSDLDSQHNMNVAEIDKQYNQHLADVDRQYNQELQAVDDQHNRFLQGQPTQQQRASEWESYTGKRKTLWDNYQKTRSDLHKEYQSRRHVEWASYQGK